METVGIIGGGIAGYTAALDLRNEGISVILFECLDLGGVCLNRGCIPTKTLISAAHRGLSWQQGLQAAREAVLKLRQGLERSFDQQGIRIVRGKASLRQANAIECDGEEYQVDATILALGSRPFVPAMFENAFTSANLPVQLPSSITIIGGGYIGTEFASIFKAFGSEVNLVEQEDRILSGFTADVAQYLQRQLQRKGVAVHTGKAVADCAGKELVLDSGESLRSEAYLVACGRRPVFPEGSFAKEHLVQKDGRLVVDDRYMTSVDGVYAIGDCVTGPMLAHKAAFDAHQVSRILSGRAKGMPREYSHIPAVVFSDPPLAAIGNLSGERVKVPLASIGRAYCDDLTGGFVSLYIQEGRVAGGVVIASRAEDILGALTIAVSSRVRVEDLAATVFAHPTYAEILSEAARRFLAAQ